MAIMLVGGNGFLGSQLLRELVAHGEMPVSFDRKPLSEMNRDLSEKIVQVQGDATCPDQILAAIKDNGVRRVVHLSSLVTLASQRNPEMVHKLNLGSTLNILEAARQCGLGRVVYASSLAVYGKTPLDELVTEEAPLAPVSLYGASKVYCEQLGNAYKSEFGIDFVAVRLPAMWGPGKNQLAGKSSLTGSGRFSEIVEKPAKGEPVTVTASNQRYDLLFTKDAGQLIRRLLSAKQLQYTAYNAGSGTFVTLQEIAEELKKYLPQSEITFEEGYDFFAIPCQGPLSTERAVRELGYQPIYQLGEAVRDYLSALRG